MPISLPYKFSDWYGYDKDCTPVGPAFYMTNSGVVTNATPAYACNYIFDGSFYASIYYHDGTGATPVVGDVVYTDAAGNNEYNPTSNLWKGNATGHTSGGTGLYRFDSGSGQVEQLYTCGLSSFSSSVDNNPGSVCSATMNQTYYHNGSGTIPVSGDTTYSSNSGAYPYLSAGNYKISSTQYITVGSNGLVSSINTCITTTSFSSGSGQADTKFICTQSVNTTKYHDGSGNNPATGDTVYENSAGTSFTANGFYTMQNAATPPTTIGYYRITGGSGVVASMGLCFP
jgi:hypothetical protein